jgi:hypothetical protein
MGGLCGVSPRQGENDPSHRQRRSEVAIENNTAMERKKESAKKVNPFVDMEEYNGKIKLTIFRRQDDRRRSSLHPIL